MHIRRLLHSSFCFLNTNTAITRQLIRTARALEAEWWQVCGEAWVRGRKKMSQVLGAFGLLDFTMLRLVVSWRAFLNLWAVYFFNFPIFFSARGQPRIRRSTCITLRTGDTVCITRFNNPKPSFSPHSAVTCTLRLSEHRGVTSLNCIKSIYL